MVGKPAGGDVPSPRLPPSPGLRRTRWNTSPPTVIVGLPVTCGLIKKNHSTGVLGASILLKNGLLWEIFQDRSKPSWIKRVSTIGSRGSYGKSQLK